MELRPNVNRGRQQLLAVLRRVEALRLDLAEQPHADLTVDLILDALDGYLVRDRELIACSDEAIADARAQLSASVRKVLDDEVRR